MAVSPRRSSRARTSQPNSIAQQHTNSSSSSVASSRGERSARSTIKMPSPRGSVVPRSHSRGDPEETEKSQVRRTRSSQEESKGEAATNGDDDVDEEGEEEVTRCICNSQEYPGLPVTSKDTPLPRPKDDPNSSGISEDSTGWFIQCDSCKVWQHGGCVGIMDEATSPDEYFCEQCRKDLHKVLTDLNGRRYSLYIPAQSKDSEPSSPEPRSKNGARRTRDSRNTRVNADSFAKGRRATMNSRDSAYDEAEQLRRAIEESKKESLAAGTRKTKRSRSESEERGADNKRRRTTSDGSSSSQSKNHQQDGESDGDLDKDQKTKMIRGAAARNQKAKQERERGAIREPEKLESTRRKSQVEPRRDDESDGTPPPPSRTNSKNSVPTEKTLTAPPIPEPPASRPASNKKTGRPPAARRGRVGRNQYTKDRDLTVPDTGTRGASPARSVASQEGEGAVPQNGTSLNADSNTVGKPSRPRHMNPNRTTMNDMKRRVAGILEFISHTQVEMAALEPSLATAHAVAAATATAAKAMKTSHDPEPSKASAPAPVPAANPVQKVGNVDEEAFTTLTSIEMMEVLTRKLMRWQGEYGKWGEK